MCNFLAGQDPARFERKSRSVRISGQATSIRLERAFWQALERFAAREGLSLAGLVTALHDEAVDRHGQVTNLSSLLRTVCLLDLEERVLRSRSATRSARR